LAAAVAATPVLVAAMVVATLVTAILVTAPSLPAIGVTATGIASLPLVALLRLFALGLFALALFTLPLLALAIAVAAVPALARRGIGHRLALRMIAAIALPALPTGFGLRTGLCLLPDPRLDAAAAVPARLAAGLWGRLRGCLSLGLGLSLRLLGLRLTATLATATTITAVATAVVFLRILRHRRGGKCHRRHPDRERHQRARGFQGSYGHGRLSVSLRSPWVTALLTM
jgi:hypothetical protein